MTLFQNCLNGSVWKNKLAIRAKKKKKGIDYHASSNNLLKRHLLNELMDFEQECSLSDPLPKLLKWSCSAEQNGSQS